MTDITVYEACNKYLDMINLARSANTSRAYRNGIRLFLEVLADKGIDPHTTHVIKLSEDAIAWLAAELNDNSPATERLYLTAVTGFYEYLAAEALRAVNLPRVRLLIRQRSRRAGQRLPQFPREDIVNIINYAINLADIATDDIHIRLRNLRDRAFLITLADTGLRVHEACNLRRGDIDWNESRALLIGKGNRQDVIRLSTRSMNALRDYLSARSALDGSSGRPLVALPLFARHDRGAGKKVKPITTTTGRNIVSQRVREALGSEFEDRITPHSFRHYFVTTVLRGSGGNLKLAQELARHRNISVTQRYAHLSNDELDQSYYDIFDHK